MKKFYSAQDIYKEIKKDIVDLKLIPGQIISENEMAEKFQVSRTIIRTAFVKLKIEKLVVVYPQRGTAISLIDLKYVSDLLYLRVAIEKQVCIDAINHLDSQVMLEIEHNLKKQAELSESDRYNTECRLLDEEFHRLLFKLVGREHVWDMVSENAVHFQRYRNLDVNLARRFKQIIKEHHFIYNAIREKDQELLSTLIFNHLFYSFQNVYQEILKKYPEYFVNIN